MPFSPLRRFLGHPNRVKTLAFWAAAVTTSLAAVLFTQLFKYGESFFAGFYAAHPLGAWAWTPLCFVGSWYLVWKFSPPAAGSGIPQVLAAKDSIFHRGGALTDRLLSLRVIAVKVVGALLGVSGGAAIGREGPTLQIGASVYRLFQRRAGAAADKDRELWLVAGASTGLAAAFNTPLGGIVFAIEELQLASFHRFRTALLSSIIVGGLVSQWVIGPYLYLGMPVLEHTDAAVFPYALAAGVAGGLLGAAFGSLLGAVVRAKGSGVSLARGATWAVLTGLFVSLLIHLDPRNAGSGSSLMNGLLFRGGQGDPGIILGRFASMTASYASGGSGGIFAPSLAAGACLGSWLGLLFHGASTNLMVLLGMIAFLTGVTRTPFTAFVLVLEMTDRHSAIFPMMVAALAAEAAARLVNSRSFYEEAKTLFLKRETRG